MELLTTVFRQLVSLAVTALPVMGVKNGWTMRILSGTQTASAGLD